MLFKNALLASILKRQLIKWWPLRWKACLELCQCSLLHTFNMYNILYMLWPTFSFTKCRNMDISVGQNCCSLVIQLWILINNAYYIVLSCNIRIFWKCHIKEALKVPVWDYFKEAAWNESRGRIVIINLFLLSEYLFCFFLNFENCSNWSNVFGKGYIFIL